MTRTKRAAPDVREDVRPPARPGPKTGMSRAPRRAGDAAAGSQDATATGRWLNEGGRMAAEAMIEHETAAEESGPGRPGPGGRRVVIAGAGVAGLEALLALRALAGDRVEITLVAPELKFLNRSMSVAQPFHPQRVRGLRLEEATAEQDVCWHRGTLDRVEHDHHRAITRDGAELPYDALVLALGAHCEREWESADVLTFNDDGDGADYRLLLDQLREGAVEKLAFVKPGGPSWPLPLYDLALMTAARCVVHGRSSVELSLVTPEQEPLAIFGHPASAAVRRLLEDSGVTLYTSSYGVPSRRGWLDISPGQRGMPVDRVVTEPRLVGPRLRGVPCDRDGFIHTDAHGRLAGLDGIFAAGDATTFPIKQGGLAAEQADAVAEAIVASVGVEIDPQPFQPILRGVLLTGGRERYLRADLGGRADEGAAISSDPLWWPPDKLAGRYLAPYLASQVGDAADVMPQGEHAIRVETLLDPLGSSILRGAGGLSGAGPGPA